MPLLPEMRGGSVPRISLAAVAVVAMTVENAGTLAPDSLQYANPTRPTAHRYPQPHDRRADPDPANRPLHPHHSQTHPTPAQIAMHEVTREEFVAWSKVNVCEEGGDWHVRGSKYSGGLGIANDNWVQYGGEFFSHSAADATPAEQIVVAMRIQPNPPDQHGCGPGW